MFCSYIQRLLDRISNGTLPDDRRSAIVELQSVVAESNAAQLAFGAASGKSLSFFSVLRLTECEIKLRLRFNNFTFPDFRTSCGSGHPEGPAG